MQATIPSDPAAMMFCGEHLLAEVHGIGFDVLDDADYLAGLLADAVERAGATACGELRKKFEPQGVTILILLEESHASLHSYPEAGSMFIDIFTCGTRCQPRLAFQHIVQTLGAGSHTMKVLSRGGAGAAPSVRTLESEVCA